MFRCHFCVRMTGARYSASALDRGNAVLASVIDEVPTEDPSILYVSGGLEPLTNPGLGGLVARAARRGLRITMYSNAFALTEQTLRHQPGLWDVHAVRASFYGLSDEEYEATVARRGAFSRVRANLAGFLKLRAEQERPVRLGLNYLVLRGRAHRLQNLLDFMVELSEVTPNRPLDFLNLREDYSGREDGALSPVDRAELLDGLGAFEEAVARRLPHLEIDYGYALNSLRLGFEAGMLRIRPEQMRPRAHPQVAVQLDLEGDVYLYREAGFPDLPGAGRYIAGRVSPERSLAAVVEDHVVSGRGIQARPGDEYFLDGFDQVITARLNQLEQDLADGWGPARGFLR
jgi:dTDP-4-amino-4,6-dideoxy-D-glucose ammonia-lyase